MSIKINCVWAADNFLTLDTAFLFNVLLYPSTFVYYLLFVKWSFIFALRRSGPAKTGPAGLVAMALLGTPLITEMVTEIYLINLSL